MQHLCAKTTLNRQSVNSFIIGHGFQYQHFIWLEFESIYEYCIGAVRSLTTVRNVAQLIREWTGPMSGTEGLWVAGNWSMQCNVVTKLIPACHDVWCDTSQSRDMSWLVKTSPTATIINYPQSSYIIILTELIRSHFDRLMLRHDVFLKGVAP